MPKSKRDKKISLTKTKKKGLELKQHVIDDIRSSVEKYERIFLFSVQNMRNNKLKELRAEWTDSRFFFGKNKIMALAFGKSSELEVAEGIHKLANALNGQCGLLFTNRPKKKVLEWMEQYGEEDYARSGFVTEETIILSEGPMPDFPHSIEPYLRQQLGMPTALQKGVVTLVREFQVCKEGQTLTPEQARILKLLGRALATFQLTPLGVYTKKHGYKKLKSSKTEAKDVEGDMEVDGENT